MKKKNKPNTPPPRKRGGILIREPLVCQQVTVYQEAFNTKFDGNTETMETSFVLDGVIGGWKMNSEDISEVIP